MNRILQRHIISLPSESRIIRCIILVLILLIITPPVGAVDSLRIGTRRLPDSLFIFTDTTYIKKKRPWRAAAEALGINLGVFSFDRFVMNEDFAQVNMHTIRHNLKTGFVWDNDPFQTNLFAHPYHGSLYFNSARSSGLSFWQSAPYAFAGSLTWELFAESEPPAINDLMATTMGGIALGEITHRMSALVLDDSKRGFPRFLREFGGFLLCPVQGFNRLISGDMWRVKHSHYLYHDYDRIPVQFSVGGGWRYLADDNHFFKGDNVPFLTVKAIYGDIFDNDNTAPYDYFTLSANISLSDAQPLLTRLNLVGRLWSTPLTTNSEMNMAFGIFQQFNFFNSDEIVKNSGRVPYKISEVASVGPGLLLRFPKAHNLFGVEQRILLGGILLGGSYTDYYNFIDRRYNMGSGYSIKNTTVLDFGRYGSFSFNAHFYQIFTWKGYEHKDLTTVNPLYLNAQGDKGNAILTVINPILELKISPHLSLNAESNYFMRFTHYSFHDDVKYRTFETSFGLMYNF